MARNDGQQEGQRMNPSLTFSLALFLAFLHHFLIPILQVFKLYTRRNAAIKEAKKCVSFCVVIVWACHSCPSRQQVSQRESRDQDRYGGSVGKSVSVYLDPKVKTCHKGVLY